MEQNQAIPTPRQLEYQDWEMGIFLHFGIRTFYEGHEDWDGRQMPADAFDPVKLDCDQWTATAAEAGMRYAILVCKHHDGFANWPSRYTSYSVAAAPWKDGKGDVVREFTDACRKRGLKVGLYYSPADAEKGKGKLGDQAYDDYFINQVGELLSGYGKIDILWFDGCGSEDHRYNWERITREIRRMQPGILLFQMGDPDIRWVGNEEGFAPEQCRNVVNTLHFSIQTELKRTLPASLWLPAECDTMLRHQGWFYNEADKDDVKSLDELLGIYYYSVGRGSNLLLNVGPGRDGLLPKLEAERLISFGRSIRHRFAHPVARLENFTSTPEGLVFNAKGPFLVDHAVLMEELAWGEKVENFRILAYPCRFGDPIILCEGKNIGHKVIRRFPTMRTEKAVVQFSGAEGAKLRNLELYYVGGGPDESPDSEPTGR